MRMPPSTPAVVRLFVVTALVSFTSAIASGQGVKQQPPVLTAFSINAGVDSVSSANDAVVLTHTVVGTQPTEFRVSHRADFAGARWAHMPRH